MFLNQIGRLIRISPHIVQLACFLELGNETTNGAIGIVDRGRIERSFIFEVAVDRQGETAALAVAS